jgi:hypothetical protein
MGWTLAGRDELGCSPRVTKVVMVPYFAYILLYVSSRAFLAPNSALLCAANVNFTVVEIGWIGGEFRIG